MALPRSLTQPLRQNLLFVGSGWRGYFAPYNTALAVTQNNTSVGPTIYDLETMAAFTESSPPAGWTDLGFIDKFKFSPGSKIGSVKTGYRMATRARYRGEVDEKAAFTFRESTHLAMKIASGAQVFNLLADAPQKLYHEPNDLFVAAQSRGRGGGRERVSGVEHHRGSEFRQAGPVRSGRIGSVVSGGHVYRLRPRHDGR